MYVCMYECTHLCGHVRYYLSPIGVYGVFLACGVEICYLTSQNHKFCAFQGFLRYLAAYPTKKSTHAIYTLTHLHIHTHTQLYTDIHSAKYLCLIARDLYCQVLVLLSTNTVVHCPWLVEVFPNLAFWCPVWIYLLSNQNACYKYTLGNDQSWEHNLNLVKYEHLRLHI